MKASDMDIYCEICGVSIVQSDQGDLHVDIWPFFVLKFQHFVGYSKAIIRTIILFLEFRSKGQPWVSGINRDDYGVLCRSHVRRE